MWSTYQTSLSHGAGARAAAGDSRHQADRRRQEAQLGARAGCTTLLNALKRTGSSLVAFSRSCSQTVHAPFRDRLLTRVGNTIPVWSSPLTKTFVEPRSMSSVFLNKYLRVDLTRGLVNPLLQKKRRPQIRCGSLSYGFLYLEWRGGCIRPPARRSHRLRRA